LSNQINDALTSKNPPVGFIMSVQRLVEGFAGRVRDAYEQMAFPSDLPREGVATRVAPETLAQMRPLISERRP
jgi:hypothetical protein